MRKLAGYLAHRASVRLHEAAVGLLDDGKTAVWFSSPVVEVDVTNQPTLNPTNITLTDVAPRLAAAVEAIGDRVQHAKWLASIVGLERMTRNR